MRGYEFWYSDDEGNRLAYIDDVISFEYVKVLGDMGFLALFTASRGQVYDTAVPDRRVAVYRQPIGSVLSLDFLSLLRQFDIVTSTDGLYQRTLQGNDLNELLSRRIVAYYAASAEATQTGAADDLMKSVVTDNLIDNADYSGTPSPSRSISGLGFSVQSNLTAGPSITKAFSWRNVLAVLQDLQADSKTQGTEVFFDTVATTETAAQFRTWTTPRDRTVSGINPLIFSLEWGNLSNPRLVDDYSSEVNYIYAGGQGEEENRIVQAASDTARINASVLNRREAFAHSAGKTTTAVSADARNDLERSRPTRRFFGTIADTPLTPYGGIQGWQIGDKVTVSYAGAQFDVIIRAVHVKMDAQGDETITAKVEA